MLSVKAIYDGEKLELLEKLDIKSPQQVIIVFLNLNDVTDEDINVAEIQTLAQHSGALDFLYDEEEDIYTDADLKVRY